MNKQSAAPAQPESGQYRSLQILDELANNDTLTQRDLSQRLGIALGLVNSYVKNLVAKGYITVKNIPPKRYAYYLTPKGFTEKTRLAYDLLSDYTRIYREAKQNFQQLFHQLEQKGTRRVVFAGTDEVAEIAFITLQETELELAGVVDNDRAGELFFGQKIGRFEAAQELHEEIIIITSYVRRQHIYTELMNLGIADERIRALF